MLEKLLIRAVRYILKKYGYDYFFAKLNDNKFTVILNSEFSDVSIGGSGYLENGNAKSIKID